jgi:hypothetical protein
MTLPEDQLEQLNKIDELLKQLMSKTSTEQKELNNFVAKVIIEHADEIMDQIDYPPKTKSEHVPNDTTVSEHKTVEFPKPTSVPDQLQAQLDEMKAMRVELDSKINKKMEEFEDAKYRLENESRKADIAAENQRAFKECNSSHPFSPLLPDMQFREISRTDCNALMHKMVNVMEKAYNSIKISMDAIDQLEEVSKSIAKIYDIEFINLSSKKMPSNECKSCHSTEKAFKNGVECCAFCGHEAVATHWGRV